MPSVIAKVHAERSGIRSGVAIAPVLVGLLATVAAAAIADQPLKVLFYRVASLTLLAFALRSQHAKRILLFFWTATLTYNRNYFIDALGNNGSYGLYWNPADVFLGALLGLWAFEAIVQKRTPKAQGNRLWPWFLPFAAGCVLSMPGAEHAEWTAFELTRVVRMALILCYVRYNVRREEWWACIGGFAVAILLQSAMALQFVVTGRRFGVTAVLGLSPGAAELQAAVAGVDANMGLRRGEGTMGHPNTLAIYFLLTGPLFAALALAAKSRRTQLLAAAPALAALMGIASTLSRTSWVITSVQMIGLAALLVMAARVSPKRILGLAAVAGFAALLAIAPLLPTIQRRFFSNFGESVDFRVEHGAIALDIWSHHPIFGVGLNNYSNTLLQYDLPEVKVFLELSEIVRTTLGIRGTAWVHNIYLLMLGETGLVGLFGFLVFLSGALFLALRSASRTTGDIQLVSIGLLVGMIGVYLHGLQESALWIDPITYTFTLVVALVAVARECSVFDDAVPEWIRDPTRSPRGLRPPNWSLE